jgi:hypothetical protein
MMIIVAIAVLLGLLFWFCQRFPGINYATSYRRQRRHESDT